MEEECVPKMNVGLGTKILNMGKYLVYCVIDFDCLQNILLPWKQDKLSRDESGRKTCCSYLLSWVKYEHQLDYLVPALCPAIADMSWCHYYILVALFWNQFVKCSLLHSTPHTCLMEDLACEAHSDNVIGTGDADLATCRALCSYHDDCNFITFFDSESFPLHDYCMLFSSCDSQHECDHCSTEPEDGRREPPRGELWRPGGEQMQTAL